MTVLSMSRAEIDRVHVLKDLLAERIRPSEAAQLIEAVKALHPDEMSPREALEAIYMLKAKLPRG